MVKKITQETFDAAVAENVQEFGMSPEDALADAIKQFESQGNWGRRRAQMDRADERWRG